MSDTALALLGLLVLVLLMFNEMPVAFALGLAGFLGLWAAAGLPQALNIVGSDMWEQFGSYALSVIPMFVLMGNIAFRSGVTTELFEAAGRWIGHVPGGLAATSVVASAGFGAICGSNTATCATMGTIALPIMKKMGYADGLASGAVAGGGTLGIVIPPSVALIIVGIQGDLSIGKLFIGILPIGIVVTLAMMLTAIGLAARNPALGPRGPVYSWGARLKSLGGIVEVLVVFGLMMAGIYLGWFTPTEGGAFGSAGVLIISLARRKLSWANFKLAVRDTIGTSIFVMLTIWGGMVFSRFLTMTRLPQDLAEWVTTLPVAPIVVMIMICAVYIVFGALADALSFLVLSIPVFLPAVLALGYDGIWFGVLATILTTFGALTPPVGLCLFVVKNLRPEVPMGTIIRGSLWFLVCYVLAIALLLLLPPVVTLVAHG